METRSSQGSWERYILFLVLVFGIFMLNMYLMSVFGPPPKKGVPKEPAVEKEHAAAPRDEKAPEPKPPQAGESPEPGRGAERAPAAKPAEKAGADDRPGWPRRYATLGSVDPRSPYRMLVTLTSQGAAVARIELSSPRYRDSEDYSGYLGHLVVDPDVQGKGCPVQVVGLGTPAARAGLRPGDVIVAVDGRAVTGVASLERELRKRRPKQVVKLAVLRDGKPLELSAPLAPRPLEVLRPEIHPKRPIQPPTYDPLSFLVTLYRIDDEQLEPREPPKVGRKEPKPRPPDVDQELAGLDLRGSDWELVRSGPSEAVFRYRLPRWGLELTKTYRLEKVPREAIGNELYPAYHLTLGIEIRNVDQAPHQVAYQLDGPTGLPTEGYWYASKVSRGWGGAGIRDVVVSFDGGEPGTVGAPRVAKDDPTVWKPFVDDAGEQRGLLSYIGVDAQYFSVVMIPQRQDREQIWLAQSRPLRVGPVHPRWLQLTNTSCRLVSRTHELEPGQSFSHTYQVFVGPKKPALLAKYGLKEVVYYGWYGWVAVPMLAILHFFHDYVVFNYGLAIIMLTVVVRLCMFPLSKKQALNAQKMQELQPEIKRIAEKYKNDMQKRSKAQQELFKKHNFNPMGGCLPLFVQLPIFIGLYRSLMVDVELRQAPLIPGLRWCSNLAAPDMLFDWSGFMPAFVTSGQGIFGLGPYFNLLPVLTIVLFLVQQKMFMPPATDENTRMQQNIMKFMMVFIGILFFKVASGLCLYFIASSLWGVAERKLLPKKAAQAEEGEARKAARPKPRPMPVRSLVAKGRVGGDGAATGKKKKKSRGRR